MNKENVKYNGLGAVLFIILAVSSRFISALPNFSALEAVALFSGAYIVSRYAYILVPVVAMYLGDALLNNTLLRGYFPDHSGLVLWSDYMLYNSIALIVIAIMGRYLLKKVSLLRVVGGSISASLIFFLITNTGAWLSSTIYSKDAAGLIASYTAGLPFLQNSLISALLFSVILFGIYEMVTRTKAYQSLVGARA